MQELEKGVAVTFSLKAESRTVCNSGLCLVPHIQEVAGEEAKKQTISVDPTFMCDIIMTLMSYTRSGNDTANRWAMLGGKPLLSAELLPGHKTVSVP